MNILWVEDFGGNDLAPEHLANNLFSYLLTGDEGCFDGWDQEPLTEDSGCSQLPDFTDKASDGQHKITLHRHYTDYHDAAGMAAIDHDLYIIDIRLNDNLPQTEERKYPEEFSDDKADFDDHAGLYIYNDLIRRGVPQQAIAILTGQESTLKEFEETQRRLYWPGQCHAFEKKDYKGDEGDGLRVWLQEATSDPYRILRRGVLQGCDELLKIEGKLRFEQFISRDEDGELTREFTAAEFRDYLITLCMLLISPQPPNKNTILKSVVSSLVHPWEGAKLARNRENNPGESEVVKLESASPANKQLVQYGWILKNARNWMSHGAEFSQSSFSEAEVAALMLINFRCMVELGDSLSPYEEMLFGVIDEGSQQVSLKLEEKKRLFWGKVKRTELRSGGNPLPPYSMAINNEHEACINGKSHRIKDFKKALLSMVYFVDVSGENDPFLNRIQQALSHHIGHIF